MRASQRLIDGARSGWSCRGKGFKLKPPNKRHCITLPTTCATMSNDCCSQANLWMQDLSHDPVTKVNFKCVDIAYGKIASVGLGTCSQYYIWTGVTCKWHTLALWGARRGKTDHVFGYAGSSFSLMVMCDDKIPGLSTISNPSSRERGWWRCAKDQFSRVSTCDYMFAARTTRAASEEMLNLRGRSGWNCNYNKKWKSTN